MDEETLRTKYNLGEDKENWSVEKAKRDIERAGFSESQIQSILCGPFDMRTTFFTGISGGFHSRPSGAVMRNMIFGKNVGLLIKRQNKKVPFSYAFVSRNIVESSVFESAYANNTFCPLYLYPDLQSTDDVEQSSVFDTHMPNLNEGLLVLLKKTFNMQVLPEEVFSYVYSVLYSNAYRANHADSLKKKFPRIPFTDNHTLFVRMAQLGQQLVDLHLLESEILNKPLVKFLGAEKTLLRRLIIKGSTIAFSSTKNNILRGLSQRSGLTK